MSDIHGKGWGSSHDWVYQTSNNSRHSFYQCRVCNAWFSHDYHNIPDIFEALKKDGLHGLNRFPDKCPKQQSEIGTFQP